MKNFNVIIERSQKELTPAIAKVVIQAVQEPINKSEITQLVTVIKGRGLSAESLLVAIRHELDITNKP